MLMIYVPFGQAFTGEKKGKIKASILHGNCNSCVLILYEAKARQRMKSKITQFFRLVSIKYKFLWYFRFHPTLLIGLLLREILASSARAFSCEYWGGGGKELRKLIYRSHNQRISYLTTERIRFMFYSELLRWGFPFRCIPYI